MRVTYSSMALPMPSEAFAGTDIRTLINAGADVWTSATALLATHRVEEVGQ